MNGFDTRHATARAPNYGPQTLSHLTSVIHENPIIHETLVINEQSCQSDEADISRNSCSITTIYEDFILGDLVMPKTQVKPLESCSNDNSSVQSYNHHCPTPKSSSSCDISIWDTLTYDELKNIINITESSSTLLQIDQLSAQVCDEKAKLTPSNELKYVNNLVMLAEWASTMPNAVHQITPPNDSRKNGKAAAIPIGRRVPRYAPYGKREGLRGGRKRCMLLDLDLQVFVDELDKKEVYDKDGDNKDGDDNDADYLSNSDGQLKRKRAQNANESRSTTWSDRQVKGIKTLGLSRYSPYGTRFSAMMDDGSFRESYLAGDLLNRSRVKGGKRIGLNVVHHQGEIEQLDLAWDLIKNSQLSFGAGAILEHLRSAGQDINYRNNNSRMLLKNAGNFLKRVQEFGLRRVKDPSYLKTN